MSTHNKICSNQIKYSTRRCGQKLWSLIFFDQALNHKIRFYSNKQNIIFFFSFSEKFVYRKFLDYLFCTTLILFNINKIHRLTLFFFFIRLHKLMFFHCSIDSPSPLELPAHRLVPGRRVRRFFRYLPEDLVLQVAPAMINKCKLITFSKNKKSNKRPRAT